MNTQKNLTGAFALIKEVFREFLKDRVPRLSAALSYYALFSAAPLLLIAVGVSGWIYGEDAGNGDISRKFTPFVGWQAAEALQSLLKSASEHSNAATIVGFAALLIGASTVFGQLQDSLNQIWDIRVKPGISVKLFIRQRLLAFAMVLGIGTLFLSSLVVAALVTTFAGWLKTHLGFSTFITFCAGFAIPVCMETLLFAMLFKFLPDVKIRWRSVWAGAAVTALLFEVGKIGLSLYLGRNSATSSFGAAGSVVLLLLWIYYASTIFFFGAEFTEVYARRMGHVIEPNHFAERISEVEPRGTGLPAAAPDPTPEPRKESLAPLLLRAEQSEEDVRQAGRSNPLFSSVGWGDAHPVAEVVVAFGGALAVGLVLRLGSKALKRR